MPVFLKKWGMKESFYSDSLIFFYLAGGAAGTMLVYLLRQQITDLAAGFSVTEELWKQGGGKGLLTAAARQRCLEVVFGWLLGLTSFSAMAFWGIAAYMGLTSSVLLCMFTMEKGAAGIGIYAASLFPHFLIYGMVWLILASWAGRKPARPRILSLLLLLLMTGGGAFLETAVSPMVVRIFL